MMEMFREIHQSLRNGRELAVAAIISDNGSTPRRSGSKMIVYPNGAISGTIGGGAVEGDVIQRALRLFETPGAEIVSYDLTREANIDRMDLICGGRIQILIEHVPDTERNIDLYHSAKEELDKGRPFWWIGKITDDKGQLKVERALHKTPNEFIGSLHLQPEFQKRLEADTRIPDGSCFIELERQAYVIESIKASPTLFLIGAGHVSKEIGAMGHRVGYRTIVFDDRAEFANAERFPDADAVRVCPGFTEVFQDFDPRADDFIVIVTRGHRFDREVLGEALKTRAGYIGMIGSRRKRDAIYKELIERGVSPETLKQVRCPIGLPIEAETPTEIAVSVMAQLIQHRARRRNHEEH
jgi:xanthine dehydrogenase accessory factor